jgi:hypothetical protein
VPPSLRDRTVRSTYDAAVRASEVKQFARALPGTTEEAHGGRPAFRVKGRVFAVFQPGEEDLVLYVAAEERQALLVEAPAVFEAITNRRGVVVEEFVTVHLAGADAAQIRELLEDGWRRFAPKRAVDAYDGAARGT